jgi:hypothetical protein
MQIAVGGFLAQKDQATIVERAPYVDVVFGTHNVGSLPVLLERARVATGAARHVARLPRRRLRDRARRACLADGRGGVMPTWRITRRPFVSPQWPLVEDVEADDFVIENDGRQLVLYRDELVVVESPRRVVVARLDANDIVAVEQL